MVINNLFYYSYPPNFHKVQDFLKTLQNLKSTIRQDTEIKNFYAIISTNWRDIDEFHFIYPSLSIGAEKIKVLVNGTWWDVDKEFKPEF